MDVTLKVRVPKGIDEKLVGEMTEIFARAQALRMLASNKRKVRAERASWGELREYLQEYRDFSGQ
ncbi:hypothetical protein A3L11_00660 [Thermococcus siculi]|uniref:Uncharacterized protein n=1 Tax=Thermococcus siculi TaxID=72803 RepID=A0A2Z2MJN1_9EURY|nr:hypothetical protein [Thermococcus siculi]ASJ07815.1 hypothetical protein A3L11_00660 [Thermococcus siculi]